jgi:hypothetical protein
MAFEILTLGMKSTRMPCDVLAQYESPEQVKSRASSAMAEINAELKRVKELEGEAIVPRATASML